MFACLYAFMFDYWKYVCMNVCVYLIISFSVVENEQEEEIKRKQLI